MERTFAAPPAGARPWVRWWWPGGAVEDAVLAAELERLAVLGFGGVEVQPFRWGLGDAEVAAEPAIASVGTPTQLAHLAAAARAAAASGLAFSFTLGSGWPSAGAFSTEVRPQELLLARLDAQGPGTISGPLPVPVEPGWVSENNRILPGVLGPFDPALERVAVLAMPLVDAQAPAPVLGPATDLSAAVAGDTLTWDVPPGAHALVAIYRHRVAQRPVQAAYPGPPTEVHVIDHLDAAATRTLLAEQAGPFLDALAPLVPAEVFVDSPELMGELPWTTGFAARFREARGYDPTPFLPWLFRQGGEARYSTALHGEGPAAFASAEPLEGVRAREDYEDVRAEAFAGSYLAPLQAFAAARGTRLRLQAHGGWGSILDDSASVDVPESEQLYAGGSTDFLALASSAAHVAGRPTASSEAFGSFSRGSLPLDGDDLWVLAGRSFAAGLDRLVYHGLPYPRARGPGGHWYPFSSTLITQDFTALASGPWLPAFNEAMTRLQWALGQGEDRAEVAWLLPGRGPPDAVRVRAGHVAPREGESETSVALRAAGLLYDRISPRMLAAATTDGAELVVGAARYPALLLTDWQVAQPEALDAALAAARAGVPVVVVGGLPTRARGRADAAARDARVAAAATALRALAHPAAGPADLAAAFTGAGVRPAIAPGPPGCAVVSLRHRLTAGEHLVLAFNEDRAPCVAALTFGFPASRARALDPETGEAVSLPVEENRVSLTLPAARARVLIVPR